MRIELNKESASKMVETCDAILAGRHIAGSNADFERAAQTVVHGDKPMAVSASFFVEADAWKPNVRAAICALVLSVVSLLAADTNKLWWISPKPEDRPARIMIHGSNAAQVSVTIKQYTGSTNQHPGHQFPDLTATNLEIVTTHQPVLVGGSNGAWVIRFKP